MLICFGVGTAARRQVGRVGRRGSNSEKHFRSFCCMCCFLHELKIAQELVSHHVSKFRQQRQFGLVEKFRVTDCFSMALAKKSLSPVGMFPKDSSSAKDHEIQFTCKGCPCCWSMPTSQLFSILLTSFLNCSQIVSSLPTSAHLFSPLPKASQLLSTNLTAPPLLNSSQLVSALLTSCHLFSTLPTYSHLCSTHLTSSHLFPPLFTKIFLTQRSFSKEKFLPREAFKQRSFDTHRSLYTEKFLHRETVAHKSS